MAARRLSLRCLTRQDRQHDLELHIDRVLRWSSHGQILPDSGGPDKRQRGVEAARSVAPPTPRALPNSWPTRVIRKASQTWIAKWKEQFLSAGRHGLERGDRAARPSGRESQLEAEVDDLTRALGEAHVELRALKRGWAQGDGVSLSSSSCAWTAGSRSSGSAGWWAWRLARTTAAASATARSLLSVGCGRGRRGSGSVRRWSRWRWRIRCGGTARSRGCAVTTVSSSCLRVLRDAGLVLPIGYARQRRDLAGARREAFVTIPTRRNRVWQTDFFELETAGGGTWRSGDVIDYATKFVLAGPVSATQNHRDAINSLEDARSQGHDLLGRPRIDDVTDPQTGDITKVIVVSDNGPCYKSHAFAKYIASRPELTHVRTPPLATDQRRDRALPRRDQDRTPLAPAPRRRPRDERDGRGIPAPLQRDSAPRDARRRTAPRSLPHTARRHTPNAPN